VVSTSNPLDPSVAQLDGSAWLDPARTLQVPSSTTATTSAVASIRTAFERFELKYWIDERLAERVLAFTAPYLQRDPHSATREAQRNTSLYLDSRGFRLCEDHLQLSPDRSKLRIRVYGRPLGELAFFEHKRKVRVITVKDRAAVPIAEVENVLLRRKLSHEPSAGARRVLDEFTCRMQLYRAQPQLYVGCYREAFESRHAGEDVRLTIDRELVYQPAEGFRFEVDERKWRELRDGDDPRPVLGRRRAMLELKFDGAPPLWMVELVRACDLRREAFSKYTTAALALRGRR